MKAASVVLMAALCAALLTACVSSYTGSSTVVGEQMVLPEITDSSDNIAVRIFEDIKGARVWTAKDSRVSIAYANHYTNAYFGVATTRGTMTLAVEIEPLYTGDCDASTTNAVFDAATQD